MTPATLWEKARVLRRLGAGNVARVAVYRSLLSLGGYRRLLPPRRALRGPFFAWDGAHPQLPAGVDGARWERTADRVLRGELPTFSHAWARTGFPPAWHRSVLSGVELEHGARHWSQISEFGLAGGDVKGYWEAGRFDGLLSLTLGWIASRREDLRTAIEAWMDSWCAHNPANVGVHWRCGQETGIRLMHTLVALDLLGRWGGVRGTPALTSFVAEHCARIAPTMLYAVAQDNNHGTSEAAALFMGGAHIADGATVPRHVATAGRRWQALGRRWLENRIARLVLPDGSFSQHSVNYHRMMLDTCSLAELWRRRHDGPRFSDTFYARCRAATEWLAGLTDPVSGDAPNLGANDGARLLPLHGAAYRDHRPSVALASTLFLERGATAQRPDERLQWLGLEPPRATASAADGPRLWPDGGYAKLARGQAWLLLRLPRYAFRPSHADPLHLDLWVDGENVLRDGGTFSYNAEAALLRYFSGVASHNTVQFDDRDPMPRVSRFLFGRWLECEDLAFSDEEARVAAGYRDHRGASHRREVRLEPRACVVRDTIAGFERRAVVRWRFAPTSTVLRREGEWHVGERLRLHVGATAKVCRDECVTGWEARHYGEKIEVPVLEVEVDRACTITTTIRW